MFQEYGGSIVDGFASGSLSTPHEGVEEGQAMERDVASDGNNAVLRSAWWLLTPDCRVGNSFGGLSLLMALGSCFCCCCCCWLLRGLCLLLLLLLRGLCWLLLLLL